MARNLRIQTIINNLSSSHDTRLIEILSALNDEAMDSNKNIVEIRNRFPSLPLPTPPIIVPPPATAGYSGSQSLWVDFPAGNSHLNPLIGPHIPGLTLLRISAMHTGVGTVTGNTTIAAFDFSSGTGVSLGMITLSMALAAFTEVTAEFSTPVPPSAMVLLTVATGGGHRQIFATAHYGS